MKGFKSTSADTGLILSCRVEKSLKAESYSLVTVCGKAGPAQNWEISAKQTVPLSSIGKSPVGYQNSLTG